jgi:two-component system chemotaxis response regulator CheY
MQKIASIDDSRQIRAIVQGAVAVLGYDFIEAEDGVQGLERIRQHAADLALIVLDVNMPGMLGTEVLQHIKADPGLRHIPVMMVTTESESKAIIGAIKAGAINYVTKPFAQEELIAKMVESLSLAQEA